MYLYLVTYNLYLYLPYSLFAKKGLPRKSVNQLAIDYWFSLRFFTSSRIKNFSDYPSATHLHPTELRVVHIFPKRVSQTPNICQNLAHKRCSPERKTGRILYRAIIFVAKGQMYCPSFFSEWAELRRGTWSNPGPVPNSLGGAVFLTKWKAEGLTSWWLNSNQPTPLKNMR